MEAVRRRLPEQAGAFSGFSAVYHGYPGGVDSSGGLFACCPELKSVPAESRLQGAPFALFCIIGSWKPSGSLWAPAGPAFASAPGDGLGLEQRPFSHKNCMNRCHSSGSSGGGRTQDILSPCLAGRWDHLYVPLLLPHSLTAFQIQWG